MKYIKADYLGLHSRQGEKPLRRTLTAAETVQGYWGATAKDKASKARKAAIKAAKEKTE